MSETGEASNTRDLCQEPTSQCQMICNHDHPFFDLDTETRCRTSVARYFSLAFSAAHARWMTQAAAMRHLIWYVIISLQSTEEDYWSPAYVELDEI